MELKIRLPRRGTRLIFLQIFLILSVFGLISLGAPGMLTYLTDITLVLVFAKALGKIQMAFYEGRSKYILNIIFLVVIFAVIGGLFNFVNPLLFIWGVRNNFRFFAFFACCCTLLMTTEVNAIIRILKKAFHLNLLVISIEYFFLGVSNDLIGGIFGTNFGCNTYLNIFICIIVAIALGEFVMNKMTVCSLVYYIGVSLYCATISELKVFYIELIVMILAALIIKKPNIKTITLIFVGVVGGAIGVYLISSYNPEILKFFMDKDAIDYYLSGQGYTNSGDLNRFTAIQEIYNMFFKDSILNSIFGFGLGSCETSNYSFLQSEFFLRYEYLHYRWFTHAWVYLEQGIIGISLMFLFIICVASKSLSQLRYSENKNLLIAALLFTTTTLVSLIYNSGIQMEATYLIAFMCAIPVIISKENTDMFS